MARIIDKVNTFIVLYLLYFLYRLKEFWHWRNTLVSFFTFVIKKLQIWIYHKITGIDWPYIGEIGCGEKVSGYFFGLWRFKDLWETAFAPSEILASGCCEVISGFFLERDTLMSVKLAKRLKWNNVGNLAIRGISGPMWNLGAKSGLPWCLEALRT